MRGDFAVTAKQTPRKLASIPAQLGVAILVASIAVAARILIDPYVTGVQFITFFPAVMVAAYLCGSRAGLLCTATCAFAWWKLFLAPEGSFAIARPDEAISLAAFLFVGSAVAVSIGGLTAALARERLHLERQRLLLEELNHRAKNNLTIVQAIARQTLKPEACRPEVRAEFESRLVALSSAHEVLTRRSWEPVELLDLFQNLLRAIGVEDGRVSLTGTSLVLPPKAAITMTLAAHELATNALKYGALSNKDGRVDIEWAADAETLWMRWQERNGPQVRPPLRRGFGTSMVEKALARDFGGWAKIEFAPSGVVCVLEAPLNDPESLAAV